MKKFFFILSVLFLTLLINAPCLANSNIINSVLISKSKEKAQAYELNIDSTETVQYKMYVEDENSVYFDLKNSKLAKNAGTIYDDVSDIDSVTVKQTDRNRVRIYIQGKNARNTEVVFVNSLFETGENSKSVNINRPINEYQSTNYKDDLEDEEIQEWSDNSFNLSHLGLSIFKQFQKGHTGIILIFLAIIGLTVFVLKALTAKLSQENEPLIGLNNNYNILAKDDMKQKTQKRSLALQRAQAQLASAHQNYQNFLNDKYRGNIPQKHVNTDAIAKSIGLNNYRHASDNPYQNQEVIKIKPIEKEMKSGINKDYTQKINSKDNFQIPPRPKMSPVNNSINMNKNDFKVTSIKTSNSKFDYKAPKKMNNMKFLESVTKIYEQTGRTDLAIGLKNSMSKVNKV